MNRNSPILFINFIFFVVCISCCIIVNTQNIFFNWIITAVIFIWSSCAYEMRSTSSSGYKNSINVWAEIFFKSKKNIFQIISGQTHNIFERPLNLKNKKAAEFCRSNKAWVADNLHGLDFEFSKFSREKLTKKHNISVSQKTSG